MIMTQLDHAQGMLERRLQILIDEGRYRRIASLATARGVSVATVVREAIDRGLPAEPARRARAMRRILAAEPMVVPDVAALRQELGDLHDRSA